MAPNKFGELIFDESDLFDLVMRGRDIMSMKNITVSDDVNLEQLVNVLDNCNSLLLWSFPENSDIAVPEFDLRRQSRWLMPDEYKQIDIAQHILELCDTDEELQRCGQELLMYQERDLMDLLRYLHYLVSVMRENRVIWGVGRGSSVASFVLYKLGVHRIDSLYYNLDCSEFLR